MSLHTVFDIIIPERKIPLAEYDLIIKALAGRYMDKITSFIRGVEVAVEQLEDKDKETVAVKRTSDVLVKVQEDGYEYLRSGVVVPGTGGVVASGPAYAAG